jgi:hypothetical protein
MIWINVKVEDNGLGHVQGLHEIHHDLANKKP